MPGGGVGSGQDHDALTAARFELSEESGEHELKIANSIQNAQISPDDASIGANEAADSGYEDGPSTLLGRLSETSEMTQLDVAGDRLAGLEDTDLADELDAPEL